MKQFIQIFVLMLIVAVMTASCSAGKNNGLITNSCGGLSRLPKTHR